MAGHIALQVHTKTHHDVARPRCQLVWLEHALPNHALHRLGRSRHTGARGAHVNRRSHLRGVDCPVRTSWTRASSSSRVTR